MLPGLAGQAPKPDDFKEAVMKAFSAPDLRREAADSSANLCVSAGGSKEVLI